MLIVAATAFFFIIGWMAFSKVNSELQTSGFSQQGKDILTNTSNRYVDLFDGLFLTVFVLLWVVTLFLAYQIDANPIFFPITLFVFAVLVILAAVFGNTFYTFSENAQIQEYAADFTVIPFVMNNFVTTMVIIGFSVAAVMYAKTR